MENPSTSSLINDEILDAFDEIKNLMNDNQPKSSSDQVKINVILDKDNDDGDSSRGFNFSEDEDLYLVRSYKKVSRDAVTGTNQNLHTFWNRIYDTFKNYMSNTKRTSDSLRSRFNKISTECRVYNAAKKQVLSVHHTGANQEDIDHMIDELYKKMTTKNKYKKSGFPFARCNEELKDEVEKINPKATNKKESPLISAKNSSKYETSSISESNESESPIKKRKRDGNVVEALIKERNEILKSIIPKIETQSDIVKCKRQKLAESMTALTPLLNSSVDEIKAKAIQIQMQLLSEYEKELHNENLINE